MNPATDPARPFRIAVRWWLLAFVAAFVVQAAIDTFLSHNTSFDQPTPEHSWLLSMKYDTAWVSPLIWCLRQGALGLMVLIVVIQLGWGLWHWRRRLSEK